MRTTQTVNNQSLIDIAIQLYGNLEATLELMSLNYEALRQYYIDAGGLSPDEYDTVQIKYDTVLPTGFTITYDETSSLRDDKMLKRLNDNSSIANDIYISTADDVNLNVDPYAIPQYWIFETYAPYYNIDDVPGSYRDKVALLRLYNDLLGPLGIPNPLFVTPGSIIDVAFGIYPLIAASPMSQNVNHTVATLGTGYDMADVVGSGAITRLLGKVRLQGGAYLDNIVDGAAIDHCSHGMLLLNFSKTGMGSTDDVTGAANGIQLYIDGTNVFFCPGGQGNGMASASGIFADKPTLVHGQVDGISVSVYVDNVLKDRRNITGTPVLGTGALAWGAIKGMDCSDFDGTFAFMYNVPIAMNDTQRTQIANAIYYYLYNRGLLPSFTPFT